MKQHRLRALLALLVVCALVRWFFPPGQPAAQDAADGMAVALQRPAGRDNPARSPAPLPAQPAVAASGARRWESVGNAFAVRPAPIAADLGSASTPSAPVRKAKRAVVEPPPPPPPPPPPAPPPLQVIGSWNDGAAPGVFLSTPNGTVLARNGAVLLGEYRVSALTPDQISIVRIGHDHVWHFAVPKAPPRP